MPPANILSYHIAGPIAPQASVGTGGAYVTLGVCQDGATIDFDPGVHGVMSDGGGGPQGKPVEWLQLNTLCTVRFKLVPYAGNYINTLRALAIASAVEGVLPIPGTPFGANGYLPGLYLPTFDGDGPWTFPACRVVRPGSNQVSTKETTPEWEFQAIAYFNPAVALSVAGQLLYKRAAP